MFERTDIIVIPRDEYAALIRAQAIADILRVECVEMSSYDFASFAARILGASAPDEG